MNALRLGPLADLFFAAVVLGVAVSELAAPPDPCRAESGGGGHGACTRPGERGRLAAYYR